MLKKSKKIIDRFSGTEVGILVEEFTSQVKLVNEGVLGLNDKVKIWPRIYPVCIIK